MSAEVINKPKNRDSNMELLRVAAMLLVMIVHANFRALPIPTFEEAHTSALSSILRFFTESASIICVNVFILLSGWYGIKLKWSRLAEFLFQILFWGVLCCTVYWILNPGEVSIVHAVANIFMLKGWSYWFVKSYLCLYLLSPVLNAFVDTADRKTLGSLLIAFYIFQTVYGWVTNAAFYFESGYSGLSFCGLYLLARYVRKYPCALTQLNRKYDILIYASLTLCMTAASYIIAYFNIPYVGPLMWKYTSPAVILSALYFLLFFTKISFSSKLINWIAASCFAIYLLHSNAFIAKPYYDEIISRWFYSTDSTILFIAKCALLIAGYFTFAILFDKIRILLWKLIKPAKS
jgi:hypothetical protein